MAAFNRTFPVLAADNVAKQHRQSRTVEQRADRRDVRKAERPYLAQPTHGFRRAELKDVARIGIGKDGHRRFVAAWDAFKIDVDSRALSNKPKTFSLDGKGLQRMKLEDDTVWRFQPAFPIAVGNVPDRSFVAFGVEVEPDRRKGDPVLSEEAFEEKTVFERIDRRYAEYVRDRRAGCRERANLLWGLEASIPAVCLELDEDMAADEGDGCYDRLRRLYDRLNGKNYMGITAELNASE